MNDLQQPQLPIWTLLAFTLAGFITIMTEIIPAGLLPLISHDLHVSESLAGQLISVYAFGSVVTAIPVIFATRSWSRKYLFLFAISGLFIFNSLTAISSNYFLILFLRFLSGMAAGIMWGVLAGYARNIVAINLQGRAMAIVGIGQPIALCIGVPIGTWLGNLLGWRGVFLIISGLTAGLIIWVQTQLPHVQGKSNSQKISIKEVLYHPGICSILAVIFLWILAHNILYTFISPYLVSVNLSKYLDFILFIFGISSILGIWITGIFIDKILRKLVLINLLGFTCAVLLMGILSNQIWAIIIGVALWGITFGGAPTLLQTAIADTAGDHVDIAQSMLVTVFNLAVAGGGIAGGILLKEFGISSFFISMAFLSLMGLLIVFLAKKHGFKSGSRVIES
ncbi:MULTISPECIES: MFS transporter [unclassified Acinetobacter]|uniref:MFS transporter n=1 Tax=unclassified Acinetobacter TaxID=196816 RepID=UPI002934B02C|nr:MULTISPECIES: MFS transporter [unclassified Acinetobacter]WOE32320.1 MFS transporter [Acinetobacter sp. SAAs470]WOE37793.1 MFS transporter [Acinetobacter sp. SAAs474]